MLRLRCCAWSSRFDLSLRLSRYILVSFTALASVRLWKTIVYSTVKALIDFCIPVIVFTYSRTSPLYFLLCFYNALFIFNGLCPQHSLKIMKIGNVRILIF